jgi:AcrR family transcriptional regulator
MLAAEEIIREKGCQHTTLQGIMERTGLSKGAIYHYVKSKDELFGKILLQYMAENNRSFMDAVQHTRNHEIYGSVEAIMTTNTKKDISNKILIYLLSQQHNGKIRVFSMSCTGTR